MTGNITINLKAATVGNITVSCTPSYPPGRRDPRRRLTPGKAHPKRGEDRR